MRKVKNGRFLYRRRVITFEPADDSVCPYIVRIFGRVITRALNPLHAQRIINGTRRPILPKQ